jgi:glutaredoxin 3
MKPVTIYTKDYCPYCHSAKALLQRKGVAFKEIDVMNDRAALETMIKRAGGRRTVPQVFIGDQHVGGSDDIHDLDRAGQLDPLLAS